MERIKKYEQQYISKDCSFWFSATQFSFFLLSEISIISPQLSVLEYLVNRAFHKFPI